MKTYYRNLLLTLTTVCCIACQPTQSDSNETISRKLTQTINYDCRHCGMPSQDYPQWHVKMTEKSTESWFCSPRCMLLHTLPKKYTPDNLPAIQVKDYYNQQFTNARTAYYVTESDITGPMGADFIPFSDRKAAEEFMKDHAGREIWTFQRITVNIVKKAVQTHE